MAIADRVNELLPQAATEGVTVASYVTSAIAVFSRYSPRVITEKYTVSSSTYDFDLPDNWVDQFSKILQIEYPLNQHPPEILSTDYYNIYYTPTGKKLKFKYAIEDDFNLSYTALWTEDTLSDYDAESVAILAAALVCDQLAAKYAGSIDDVVSTLSGVWRTKSSEYTNARKNFMSTFTIRTGIDIASGRAAPAALYQQKTMPKLTDYNAVYGITDWSIDE